MQNDENIGVVTSDQTFVETIDFYYENGLMVLTRHYLLQRGSCCGNACRHCPYGPDDADS